MKTWEFAVYIVVRGEDLVEAEKALHTEMNVAIELPDSPLVAYTIGDEPPIEGE